MRRACLLWPVLLTLCLPAEAVTLRLCRDARAQLPLVSGDGRGVVDRLILEAAADAGIEIKAYAAPINRCREELKAGLADAFSMAPYLPRQFPFAAFPEKGGQADVPRALFKTRMLAIRRAGSPAAWDGKAFQGIQGPLLGNAGSEVPGMIARAHGLAIDLAAGSTEQNLDKLLAGRGAMYLVLEEMVAPVLAKPEYAGKVEVMPWPVHEQYMFMPLTRRFYDANPELSERLWTAIGRLVRSPAYKQALADAAKVWSPDQ